MKTCQTVGPADCSAGFLHDVVVSGILQNTSINFFFGGYKSYGISTNSIGIPTNSLAVSTNFPGISTNPCSVPTTFFRKSTTPRFSYKVSSDINKFPGNIYKSSRDIYKFPIQINKLKARIYKSQPAIDNGPLFRRSLPFSMRSATLFIDFVWHPFDFFFCLFINSERLCIYYHEEVVFWLLLRIMKQKLNY